MANTNLTELYHDLGKMPDWAYYQLNKKSAFENYKEQKSAILERLRESEDDFSEIHFSSEVTIQQ